MITTADLNNWFTDHLPRDHGEISVYQRIQQAGLEFARVVHALTPASADQTAAIRKIREAAMTAHAAVACHQKDDDARVKIDEDGNYAVSEAALADEDARFARWADLVDVQGTGVMAAPNRTFMIGVKDIGSVTPLYCRNVDDLRGEVSRVIEGGGRVWLLPCDHPCRYLKRNDDQNPVVAYLCRRDNRGVKKEDEARACGGE